MRIFSICLLIVEKMKSHMQQMIVESMAKSFKILNISYDSSVAYANQHAPNSSAMHVPLQKSPIWHVIELFSWSNIFYLKYFS
jgi:hypothetical protein